MSRVYQGCTIGAQEQEARQISLWLVIILAGACQSNNRGLALTPESRSGEGWSGGGTKRQSGIREDFNNFNTHVGFPLNCQSRQEYSQQYKGRDLVSWGQNVCHLTAQCSQCISGYLIIRVNISWSPNPDLLIIRYREELLGGVHQLPTPDSLTQKTNLQSKLHKTILCLILWL